MFDIALPKNILKCIQVILSKSTRVQNLSDFFLFSLFTYFIHFLFIFVLFVIIITVTSHPYPRSVSGSRI